MHFDNATYRFAVTVLKHQEATNQPFWCYTRRGVEFARGMIEDGLLFLNDSDDEDGSIAVIPGTIERPKDGRVTELGDSVLIYDTYQETREAIMAAKKRDSKSGTRKKSAAKKNGAPKRTAPPKPETPCVCGCGEMAVRNFRMGHDARLGGYFSKIANEKATPEQIKFAKAAVKQHGDVIRESPKLGKLAKTAGLL